MLYIYIEGRTIALFIRVSLMYLPTYKDFCALITGQKVILEYYLARLLFIIMNIEDAHQ